MLALLLGLIVMVGSDVTPRHPLLDFTLEESEQQLLAHFDRPPQVARGRGYHVLQFHALAPVIVEAGLPVEWLANSGTGSCDGKYAYTAFVNQDGKIQSILHQPDRRLPVQYLFPKGSYRDYEVVSESGLRFQYRVRRLEGGRLLITPMLLPDLKYIDQVVLIRESQIASAYPLLAPLLS